MLAGSWGHKAHAAWLEGRDWKAVLAPYEAISNDGGFADDRRGFNNIHAVLTSVFNSLHLDRLPFDLLPPPATEVTFATPLGTVEVSGVAVDVVLIGVMDGLVREKRSGHKMPLEVKFTGRLHATFVAKFANYDIQTTAYIYAAGATQDVALGECFVSAFEMAMVPQSDRQCAKHGVAYAECGPIKHVRHTFVPVHRTPQRLAEFKALALRIAKRDLIPAALQLEKHGVEVALRSPRDGMFTTACDYCEFNKWCLVNERSLTAMKTMLRTAANDDRRIKSGPLPVAESEKWHDKETVGTVKRSPTKPKTRANGHRTSK